MHTKVNQGLFQAISNTLSPAEVVAESVETPVVENADPADPNDHDMNAVAALHVGNIYHHAANLIEDHGVSGELHNHLIAGLRKLGDEHHADYNAHARHGTQGRDAHEDMSHHMTLDALSDQVRFHQDNRK